MSAQDGSETVHANAVLAGPKAILIRGGPGSGKSQLTLDILRAAPPTRLALLIADDRVSLQRSGGRLLVRAPANAGGMIELRGLGILRLPHEPLAQAGLVVDLCDRNEIERLPEPSARRARLLGVELPRLAIARHDLRAAQLCWTAVALLREHGALTELELPM